MWLVYYSRMLNYLLGGDITETLSSRSWREGRVDWVNYIDRHFGAGHCKEAAEWHQKHMEGTMKDHPELDFGPYIKCLRPQCNQQIPVRTDSPYCSHKCRQAHNVDRFVDEGYVK